MRYSMHVHLFLPNAVSQSFSTVIAGRETWLILTWGTWSLKVPSRPILHTWISACVGHQMCTNQALLRAFQNLTRKTYVLQFFWLPFHLTEELAVVNKGSTEDSPLRGHNLGNTAAYYSQNQPRGEMRWLSYHMDKHQQKTLACVKEVSCNYLHSLDKSVRMNGKNLLRSTCSVSSAHYCSLSQWGSVQATYHIPDVKVYLHEFLKWHVFFSPELGSRLRAKFDVFCS